MKVRLHDPATNRFTQSELMSDRSAGASDFEARNLLALKNTPVDHLSLDCIRIVQRKRTDRNAWAVFEAMRVENVEKEGCEFVKVCHGVIILGLIP